MTDNRNASMGICADGRGTVCIDTSRVLDSCRDRDCFENTRVYLSTFGENILNSATNIRAKSASVLGAYVGVDEVPFNCGFYRVSVRYYILTELEACLGVGKSQLFKGLSVLEKDVILYGGEGSVTTFSSENSGNYCSFEINSGKTTNPVAYVETVEPVILGTKVCEPHCCNDKCECFDLPECIRDCLGDSISTTTQNVPRLYISFGIFSVIRITRPAQLLIQATNYNVPDKECVPATSDENPCAVFRNLPFPTARFNSTVSETDDNRRNGKGCCGK